MTPKERIIVVDDEQRMCESLAALLTGEGYLVDTFQHPADAAEAIRTGRVDLVVSDIKMADMSGLDLLKVVNSVDRDIPVILMTGYASLDSAVAAISEGAYDYLMKPVEFTQLELAVRRGLDKRRSELARLRLMEELKLSNLVLNRRISEINALYEAGKSIGSAANLRELLRQILALASNVTEAQVGSVMLLDEADEVLTIAAAIGLESRVIAQTRLPLGSSIAGHVAATGEPLIIDDVENHPNFKRINRDKYGDVSLLSVPLKIKNKVIGVINMANKEGGRSFDDDDLRLLTTFASQAAVAVDDANQFERNRRRLVEFEILHELSGELSQIPSIREFRDLLVEKLRRVFPIDYYLWFDWDASNQRLVLDGSVGFDSLPLTSSGKIDIASFGTDSLVFGPFEPDLLRGGNVKELTVALSRQLDKRPAFPTAGTARAAFPILRSGDPAFVLYLGTKEKSYYTEDDTSLARLVVSQSAVLFEREKALLNATRLLTMGNMISEISHDLRRPLTAIKGGMQILAQRHPAITGETELFQTVTDEVQRMNELVKELVDFSNPKKYQTEKVDLRLIVARAAELVEPDMRKHSVTFESSFEDIDWNLIVNKNQILEAFLNLFINAIDAMPDGGSLSVVGLIERPEHKKTDYLAVRVSDSGCGIRPENLSRVFDRYFTTKDTGTGLGLAVVERIISAHDGTLAVQSVPDQGATFTLYFPLSRVE